LLTEDGTVGAEERVLGEAALAVSGADVKNLAFGLGVGVVASVNLPNTTKAGIRNFGINGIVLSRHSRDRLL
jgi:hypothetical protein